MKSLISIFVLLLSAITLMVISYDCAFAASSDRDSPDDSAIIMANVGIGYYQWKMKYASDFAMESTYDQKIQPYVLKRFEVKTRLFFLEAGASYLTDKVRQDTEFDTEEDINKSDDTMARQLGCFAGISFGDYMLKANVVYRKFVGNLRYKGIKTTGTNTDIDLYYYPEKGDPVIVPVGNEINWSTIFRLYELKLVKGGSLSRYSWDLGFQYVMYESPIEIDITIGHDALMTGTLPTVPKALMFSKFETYNLVYGFHNRYFFTNNLYLELYFPAIFGINRLSNSYLELKPQFSYPLTNITATTTGQAALRFVTRFIRLEIGADFNFLMATWNNNTKMKKDLKYLSLENGTEQTLPKDTEITANSWRYEYFWGLYAQASAYF